MKEQPNRKMQNGHEKILISGAGPAGAFASMQLSRRRIPHTLIDKASFPRDKICGDAVSGKAINLLAKYDQGLLDKLATQKTHTHITNGIYFYSPSGKYLELPFPPASGKYPPGFVITREHFDNFLFNQTQSEYCNFLSDNQIKNIAKTETGYDVTLKNGKQSTTLYPSLLIGAEGARSPVREYMFRNQKDKKILSAGLRLYMKNVEPATHPDYIELHFIKEAMPGYFWIFPLPEGLYNVGMGMHAGYIQKKRINLRRVFMDLIENHPVMKQRFAGATQEGSIKGWSLPMNRGKIPVSADGIMLTGDAGALIDPFTGEGIANAMLSGRIAAETAEKAINANHFGHDLLKEYDRELFRKIEKELRISYWLQRMTFYPRIFRRLLDKATGNPVMKDTLYNMFTDVNLRDQLRSPLFYWRLIKY